MRRLLPPAIAAAAAVAAAAVAAVAAVAVPAVTVAGTETPAAAPPPSGTAPSGTATSEPASATPAETEPATTEIPGLLETIDIGTSVAGRPITAVRRGDPDGRRVMVIGVIHGDEQAGLEVVALLSRMPVPEGVDLYLIDSMNPDGVAADIRTNANGVDLNRNFPYNWGPIAELGDWQYAGPAAASEPETEAIVEFVADVDPDLLIWYHQDAYSIGPGRGRDGSIRSRYAELTGLPMESVAGGTYTGVAAQWARQELAENPGEPGVAFIVELGGSLAPGEAQRHASAVLTIAGEDN